MQEVSPVPWFPPEMELSCTTEISNGGGNLSLLMRGVNSSWESRVDVSRTEGRDEQGIESEEFSGVAEVGGKDSALEKRGRPSKAQEAGSQVGRLCVA